MNEEQESNKLNEDLFSTIPKSLELKFPSAIHTVDMTLIYNHFNWKKFKFETYFLLCKKHSELDSPYWRFSGGFFDVYKDIRLEDTVIREFNEETGIDISNCDIKYISSKHSLTFLDSKKLLGDWAHDISFIKINFHEYERNKEILENDSILKNKTIVTRGKYGCDYQEKNYPTEEVPVKDVSGAGDTFLAGLVDNYVNTKDIESAINFAQHCTTIVIQKTGVSTI
jgi:ADP-ribose pyrophosphatase YjhB (NUDIX family)